MSNAHYLKPLLEPQTVVVIGASERSGTIGHVIFRNILNGGFQGKVWAVNPKYQELLGQTCVSSVDRIDSRVDLAIVTTAPQTIPQIIEQCGKAGIRHLVLVTNPAGAASRIQKQRIREAAHSHGVRIPLHKNSEGLVYAMADVSGPDYGYLDDKCECTIFSNN